MNRRAFLKACAAVSAAAAVPIAAAAPGGWVPVAGPMVIDLPGGVIRAISAACHAERLHSVDGVTFDMELSFKHLELEVDMWLASPSDAPRLYAIIDRDWFRANGGAMGEELFEALGDAQFCVVGVELEAPMASMLQARVQMREVFSS